MKRSDLFAHFDVALELPSEGPEPEPVFDVTVLAIVDSEDGPRVVDVTFGLALGYERPRAIRQLIERYRSQLLKLGTLPHRVAVIFAGNGATREGKEHLLNQGQANYLITRSDLPNADEACILIAKVFTAWQNGKLTTTDLATAVELRDSQECLAANSPQMADLFASISQCATKKDLQCTEIILSRKIDDLAGRQKPTPKTLAIHHDVVQRRYGGLCPCCGKIMILDDAGIKIPEVCHWDHWYKVTKVGLRDGWPVCKTCNHMLETERTSYTQEFGVFIKRVTEAETADDPMLANAGVTLFKDLAQVAA